MRRPNFFAWQFNQGVHELLEIWKNVLSFTTRFFSLWILFSTLLAPWRRDVTPRNWRGFHPIKSLELMFFNLISRFIGALVRIVVICTGIGFLLLEIVVGIILLFAWIGTPIIVSIGLFYVFNGTIKPLHAGLGFFVWLSVLISAYFKDTQSFPESLDLLSLSKHPIFERICARLGLARRRFPLEILENAEMLDQFLKERSLSQSDWEGILASECKRFNKQTMAEKFWRQENLSKIPAIGSQWQYGFTPHLDRYSQDLSEHDFSDYAKADLLGRQEEYQVLKLLLERPDQNCALIVGASGTGKKTLIHTLARSIRQGKEKGTLENARMLLLDLGRVISEVINSGEDVEHVLRMLFYEASFAGNIILVIEHLEYFLGKNSSALHPDISPVLDEFLRLPTFQIIATSTTKEYHQLIEQHEGIAKYFEVIEMREPSEAQTIEILISQLEKYEKSRILFTWQALKKIISESGRHNWQFPLPERAIDLAMDTLMFWEKNSDEQFITEKTVLDYLSLKTGVAQGEVQGDERRKLLDLERRLHKLIIGQNEAVSQVAEALRRARSGIGDSKKPIGSFLFLGPTGVGKTETAKALAKIYFGDESKMIRLDMSEFQTPSSIDRLLGSSHLNQQGRLITQVKDNPYSLLLLDEIEKAYPEILDVFLQILDEGYVTDAFGEKINFRNTIIIATSNAGAALIKRMVEEDATPEETKKAVIDWAIDNNVFRTEFLNRFDGVIFYRPLNAAELKSVVRLQLAKLARRLDQEKNIQISFSEQVIDKVIQSGYNPIFGARSINRYIEDQVESLLAKKIIAGEVTRGQAMEISL